jgi:hypothetical protein
VGVGGDNGVEEGIDGGKGGGVGAYIVFYIYLLVSAYRPSNSPLPQSVHFIPLLFHHSLKVGGGLGGTDDRKEAFEGDQELDELLFIRKRPLLAMQPAGVGGRKGQRLPCPVEVKVRRGRVVYRGGGVASVEAEAARGRKRGLRQSWGRDDTMGDVCGGRVGGTRSGGGM